MSLIGLKTTEKETLGFCPQMRYQMRCNHLLTTLYILSVLNECFLSTALQGVGAIGKVRLLLP